VNSAVADDLEIHLLVSSLGEPERLLWRRALLWSVLLHSFVIGAAIAHSILFPAPKTASRREAKEHVTLLYSPPIELTQKEPSRGPKTKLFLGETTPPKPRLLFTPRAIPPAAPAVPQPKADLAREKPPQLAPKPDLAGSPQIAPLIQQPVAAPPAPPKLVLEDASKAPAGRTGPVQSGILAQQQPGNIIEGAVRDLSRKPMGAGAGVGDGFGGGPADGVVLPSRGSAGSSLELLSDPQGVDFKPYLTRILSIVRRNWYAVIPESARLGMVRGRVAIQFIIVRSGAVSKLVIADGSGHEPLDRAAVAGISASNPFPPLPPEFRGSQVKLQFTFLYNIAIQN
jgi:TonB family protein